MHTAHVIAVQDLFDSYLLALDEDELDEGWACSLFAEDAVVEFPVGRHDGITGLAAFHRGAMAKFRRTQHQGSRAVVRVEGATATLRANLISVQVCADPRDGERLFVTGTRVRGDARRLAAGWRLTALRFALVWAEGDPPVRT